MIIAFDASPAGKQVVFEKKLYDLPQQFPRKMALGTVEAFIKHLSGEEVSPKISSLRALLLRRFSQRPEPGH